MLTHRMNPTPGQTHFVRLTSTKTSDGIVNFLSHYYILINKSGRKLVPKSLLNSYSARAQAYILSNPTNVNWMKVPADINERFMRILIERIIFLTKDELNECVKTLDWFEIDFDGGLIQ